MENPFFTNRRWYQHPDPARSPFSFSPSYRPDPTRDTRRTGHPLRPPSGPKVVQIPVRFVGPKPMDRPGAAVEIQKVFRGFLVRKCLRRIKDVEAEVDEIQARLSEDEVVDKVRRDGRERLRMNERLMSLLFKLDSVCGVDFGVRVCRKAVIRKAIALQERVDLIVDENNRGIGDREGEIRVSAEEVDGGSDQEGGDRSGSNSVDLGENRGIVGEGDQIRVSPEEINGGSNRLDDELGLNGNAMVSVECEENLGDKIMEDEGNDGGDDVGVDCEVKVSDGAICAREDCGSVVEEGMNGGDDNKRSRELLEKMMGDNERLMGMMTQLCERNKMQTKMINALMHRVELLEKAFVCDKMRRKKKAKGSAGGCREN